MSTRLEIPVLSGVLDASNINGWLNLRLLAVVFGEDEGESESENDIVGAIMPSCVPGNGSFSEGEDSWDC